MLTSTPPHLMIADPYAGGHHGYYIEVLCRRWLETASEGRLSVVVNTSFRTVHSELAAWIGAESPRIALIEAPFAEDRKAGLWALTRADLAHGRVLAEVVSRFRPDRLVLMYFDHFQTSLASNLRFSQHVRIAGIYFRPSFHYPLMFGTQRSIGQRSRDRLKRMLLRLACKNRHFDSVFSLDPFLPEYPGISTMGAKFIRLAEPTPTLNLQNARNSEIKTVSLVGSLARRKGVLQFMEAISLLPRRLSGNLEILLAGPIAEDILEPVQDWIEMLSKRDIRLNVSNRFMSDAEIERVIAQSHLVVLPYQKHIGMSNPLVRAAKYATPVLGPDFGLLGSLIRRHRLGITVDTQEPRAIMQGILDFLEPSRGIAFDPTSARGFAEMNTEDRFADTILARSQDE
ncbi:MAG TPA: glycosyltransferase [Rhodothermales bacterium]|nr:glycosyltransferase [Rhodothermales bacterium]